MARGVRLGRAAVEAGAAGVLEKLGRRTPVAGAGARSGQIMMAALLELRGAALKVAQFFSLENDWLPEGAARELSRACHRVPPMGPAFVRDAVCGQLGSVERHFVHFDWAPFAAASLGQVHAATTHAGEAVAVKIQYPGMPETVRNDMRLLRRAALVLPNTAHYLRLLAEVEERLLEECDYDAEAQSIAWFRDRLTVGGVSVPTVHAASCGRTVLTTGRLPGRHLEPWLAAGPDQAVRDLAAQRLYDTFVESLHVHGRLHADPNPGNLLFGDDGTVGLIDFGCTRWMPADFRDIVARIWRASVARDDVAPLSVQRDLGLFAGLSNEEAARIDQAVLRPFRDWVATPFLVERFQFGVQPDFVGEGRRRLARTLAADALVGVRPEMILVNRTLYGLYRVFERLGARVRCQTAWTTA